MPINFFGQNITATQFNDRKLTEVYFDGVKVFPGDFTYVFVSIDYTYGDDNVVIRIVNSNDYSVECVLIKEYREQEIIYSGAVAAHERRTIYHPHWDVGSMKVELMSINPYTGNDYYDYAEWVNEETTNTTTPLRMSARRILTEGNFTLYNEDEKK